MRSRSPRNRCFRSLPLRMRESEPATSWWIVASQLRGPFVLHLAGICIRPDCTSNKNLTQEK
jgi:hypothetical protein